MLTGLKVAFFPLQYANGPGADLQLSPIKSLPSNVPLPTQKTPKRSAVTRCELVPQVPSRGTYSHQI